LINISISTVIIEILLNKFGYLQVILAKEEQGGDIVITPDFLQSVAKIDRVLSSSRGSLLLCGKAGAGRKSAVRLVSLIHGSKLVTLNVTADYTAKNFKKELKAVRKFITLFKTVFFQTSSTLYFTKIRVLKNHSLCHFVKLKLILKVIHTAAFEGEQVNLVIEDYQLTDPSFLDMINSLLASGEIPGLYAGDELESFMSNLRELASQDGFIGSLTAYFAESN